MSLINDALKRARAAQQQASPPSTPNLPFRPVEAAQQGPGRGLGLGVLVSMAVVALMALLFAWQLVQSLGSKGPATVKATTATVPQPAAASQPSAAPAVASAAAPSAAAQPSPARQPVSPPGAVTATAKASPPDAAAPPASPPLASAPQNEATNAAAVTPPSPPKPAPLRLQGIVFTPTRPSAMINGKTLFVGDKVGSLRVIAIGHDSAILAGAGQTNVLMLDE